MNEKFEMGGDVIGRVLGDLTKMNEKKLDVTLFNHKWTFKMLNAAEHVNVIADSAGTIDRVARLFKLEMSTLKYALTALDDEPVTLESATRLFDNVPPMVIDKLADEYEKFRASNESALMGMGVVDEKPTETPVVDAPKDDDVTASEPRSSAKRRRDSDQQSISSVVPPSRG